RANVPSVKAVGSGASASGSLPGVAACGRASAPAHRMVMVTAGFYYAGPDASGSAYWAKPVANCRVADATPLRTLHRPSLHASQSARGSAKRLHLVHLRAVGRRDRARRGRADHRPVGDERIPEGGARPHAVG